MSASPATSASAGATEMANLWSNLPEDLQGIIEAHVFAPAAAASDPVPLATRRLAAVSKGFAAKAARIDWDMTALRWDCRAFADGELRPAAFAVRVALAVIKRELQMPGNKFPATVYQEVYECSKHIPQWRQHQVLAPGSIKDKRKLADRIERSTREFHEAFGQREASALETRARHQGIVARRIHEARLDEEDKTAVIGRLNRMFQGLNAKLRCMADYGPGWDERPDYISIQDSLTRDVALLASM